jgi:hypothetical protein
MGEKIKITTDSVSLTATLRENETAQVILDALPIEGHAKRWGEEIYFSIPVQLDEASDARQEMEVGELGYWPVGTAFCIFFGKTPASQGDEPRAYSNVNPFGKIDGDSTQFRDAKDGEIIKISKA